MSKYILTDRENNRPYAIITVDCDKVKLQNEITKIYKYWKDTDTELTALEYVLGTLSNFYEDKIDIDLLEDTKTLYL